MTDMLPCPFCGGQCIDTDFDSSFGWVLSCGDCGARGPQLDKLAALVAWAYGYDENRAKAIKAWNRRAPVSYKLGNSIYTLCPDGFTIETPERQDLSRKLPP